MAHSRVQLSRFLNLDQKGAVIAEYVWIDSSNGTRSKCKVSRPHFLRGESVRKKDASKISFEALIRCRQCSCKGFVRAAPLDC